MSMAEKSIFDVTFQELHNACNGDVCAECSYRLTGECKGLSSNLNNSNLVKIIRYVKTNAEIAKILHMSKRGVSKARRDGTLPKEYL